jgi:hypothetical protein
MNANSRSEAVWQVLHQAGALLTEGGFADPVPALPQAAGTGSRTSSPSQPAEGYDDLAVRFGEDLAFGATWPVGQGSAAPRALVLTEAPLTEAALAFVRSWFENPRVNLVLADDFFVQPLPSFAGERPPHPAFARDLCALFRPKVILSLGAGPAQKLLGAPLSLDSLRGSDYRFGAWTMVTTLDPEAFLALDDAAKPGFKAQVWKDLQRLLGKMKYG